MIHIKVYEENTPKRLQVRINDFLDSDECNELVDIKYSTMWVVNPQSSSYEDNCSCYSALIIYDNE